jgi:hypothetical protein
MIDNVDSIVFESDDIHYLDHSSARWQGREIHLLTGGEPRQFFSGSETPARLTKWNIELSDLNNPSENPQDEVIARSFWQRLNRLRHNVGHAVRSGCRQLNELAKKSGGSGQFNVAQINFGPNNNSTPTQHYSAIKDTPVMAQQASAIKSDPAFNPPSNLPAIQLIIHDNVPQNPFPHHAPGLAPIDTHHFNLPDLQPTHFSSSVTPPEHTSAPITTPISQPEEPPEVVVIPEEEEEEKPIPILPPNFEAQVHPIRRTPETERVGSVAIASINTAIVQTHPEAPTSVKDVTPDVVKGISDTGVYFASKITHFLWSLVGGAGAELGRGQDLLSDKVQNTSSDHEKQWLNKTEEGHRKIDDALGTRLAFEYDPNYQPMKVVSGEIPLPASALNLFGRVAQLGALEGSAARTGAIASEAIESITLVERGGVSAQEVGAAKSIGQLEGKPLPSIQTAEKTLFESISRISDNAKIENVAKLEKQISGWLGEGTQLIRNKAGDPVFISKDGLRKVRFDFNRPAPHENPHLHLEHLVDGEWQEISRVYPIDVSHK